MRKPCILTAALAIASLVATTYAACGPTISDSQLHALQDLHDGTNIGNTWNGITGWDNTSPCGVPAVPGGAAAVPAWTGVTCTEVTPGVCNITALELPSKGLVGVIPRSIANLASLSVLDLSSNLEVTRIHNLARLTNLTTLNLANLTLKSPPTWLGSVRSLKSLSLAACNFGGRVPKSISNLTNLETLDISGNGFKNPVLPVGFERLRKLRSLDASKNKIGGALPTMLGSFPSLERLVLSDNKFVGKLPLALSALGPRLTHLDVGYNSIVGNLPWQFAGFINLRTLALNNNTMSGSIPQELGVLVTRPGAVLTNINLCQNKANFAAPSGWGFAANTCKIPA